MIEFAAGLSVGVMLGLIAGLLIAALVPRAQVIRAPSAQDDDGAGYCPPTRAQQVQPFPYQPPIIVLAAPRAQTEQRGTTLARR